MVMMLSGVDPERVNAITEPGEKRTKKCRISSWETITGCCAVYQECLDGDRDLRSCRAGCGMEISGTSRNE